MLRGSLLVFLSRNFQKFVAALIILVIGNTLGKDGVGTYGLLVQTLTITAALATLGLGPAHVHFRGQKCISIHQVLANSLAGALLFGALAVAVFTLLRPYLDLSQQNRTLATLISLAFPLVVLQSYLDYAWIGEDRLGTYSGLMAARFVALPFFLGAALLVPATTEGKYVGIATALLANGTLSVLLSLGALTRVYGFGLDFRARTFSSVLRYGAHIQAGSIAQTIGYRFDYFLIAYFLDRGSLGLYVTATNLAEIMWVLPATLSTALLPRVSTDQATQARDVTARTCRMVFAVSVLAGVALFALAEVVLRVAFEERFLGSVAPLRILVVGTVVFSLQKVLANYFIGQGRAKWFQRATLLSMGVNLGLNLWLIPLPGWGVTGAALASTVSYSLSTAILAYLFLRWSGIPPRDILVPTRGDLADAAARVGRLRRRVMRPRHGGATR